MIEVLATIVNLAADGRTDPYSRIKSVLGVPVESADCS